MKIFSKIVGLVALIAMVVSINGCGAAKVSPATKKAFDNHETMYAQVNMHAMYGTYGKKMVNVSNYAQGTLIPVNAKVTLKAFNKRQFVFEYKGANYTLVNNRKYSGLNISGVLTKYFSKKPVDLKKFTELERKVIENPQGTQIPLRYVPSAFVVRTVGGYGETKITKGMSKEAVLVARGFPPVHGTKSTDLNVWKYWEDASTTTIIRFENNKVVSVE